MAATGRALSGATLALLLVGCGAKQRQYDGATDGLGHTSDTASPSDTALTHGSENPSDDAVTPTDTVSPTHDVASDGTSGSANPSTPGVTPDGSQPPTTDAPSNTTPEENCPPSTRLCNGACVALDAVEACGPSCVACPVPEGGSASCDANECHVICNSGLTPCGETCIDPGTTCNATCPVDQHLCGDQCTPLDNPSACGDDCYVCPVPEGAERANCENGQCSFQCQLGRHACGTECKSDDDPLACGDDCKVCPAGANEVASCVNGACTAACSEGFHLCGTACVDNDETANCGSSCQPCAQPTGGSVTCESNQCVPHCPANMQLCLGECIPTTSACDGECPSGQHDCSGVCSSDTSPSSCGDSCTACPLPQGATSTSCNQGQCDFSCGQGKTKCGDQCLSNTGPAECGAQCKQLPGPKLAVIPEGDLLVGADDLDYAKTRVQSHFETFCIDQTEVTVADYKACVDANACETPRALSGCNWGVSGLENHPVTCIDWPRADAYCRWAGKRLPSEWEWEFAARGPSGHNYPWGDAAPSSNYLNWKYEAPGGATTSVGSYPNGQTLDTHVFDMSGNVWEWTGSVYCDSKAPGAACQPGNYTARGGSFGSQYDIHVRGAWRDPDSAGDHRFGFRCAFGTENQ